MEKKRGGARPGSGAKKKDPGDKKHRTSVQIPAWMLPFLDKTAALTGKTRSAVIVDMIERALTIGG